MDAMNFTQALVKVSSLSGEIVWGPRLVDQNCTAEDLSCRIFREALIKPCNACPTLLRGQHRLEAKESLFDRGEEKGSAGHEIQMSGTSDRLVIQGSGTGAKEILLNIVWSPAHWPVHSSILMLLLEPLLEPYLEKPPRWKQLRTAQNSSLLGFARGFLKHVENAGCTRSSLLLKMLGLSEDFFQSLPEAYRERLSRFGAGSASQEDKEVQSFANMVSAICSLAANPELPKDFRISALDARRKLKEWPSRRDPRKAVALLVVARLWDIFASPGLAVRTDDVIQAAASLFTGLPDFAQIRRNMLELGILRQRTVSPSYFELDAEWCQKCLTEVLALTTDRMR